jgi:uncharacterized membrane protein
VTIVAHPEPAAASFALCNQTSQGRLWVADAITWHASGNSYGQSQGWWAVDQGACKVLVNNDISGYKIYIFAYAESDTSALWSGAKLGESNYFCVSSEKFLFKGDNMDTPCNTGSARNFRSVSTGGNVDYTLTLND